MRIRSITVQNYRVHRNLTVTFDDRLTVIGGPNESGKSTLVEAIHRALFMRYKSTGADLESMQSHLGGYPEVEVVFEVDGAPVLVRKRFRGQSGSVVLEEQGAAPLSGDKAEQRLAELLGEPAVSRGWAQNNWRHLWVWQEQAFTNPIDGTNQRASDLVSRFQANGAAVVQQSALDARLATYFAEKADTFFTRTGAIKRNSPLDLATERHRAAVQAATERHNALQRLFDAATRLEIARATLQEVAGSLAAREQELREVQVRAQQLEQLRHRATLEERDTDAARAQHEALVKREQEIKALREQVAALAERLAPMQQQASQLTQEEQAATAALQSATQQLSAIDDLVRASGTRSALAQAYLTRRELQQQQRDLEARAARAREATLAIKALRADMAALPVIDAALCQSIEQAARALDVAEAKLSAIATRVELLHTDASVELGGTALVLGQPHVITTPAELAVGTGVQVRITPGGGASVAEAQQEVHDTQRQLAALLQQTGVPTAAEARRVLDRRTLLGNELAMHEQRLAELAPAGLEASERLLTGNLAAAEAEVQRRQEQGAQLNAPASLDEARQLLASAQATLREVEDRQGAMLQARDAATARMEAAVRARQQHAEVMADQQHELDETKRSLTSQLDVHGGNIDRAQALAAAEAAHRTAAGTLSATLSAIAALDPEGVDEQLRMFTSAVNNLQERRASAQREELLAQKELEQDGSRDPHAELALAEAQEREAAAHLARVQLQANAVRDLRDLYADEQRQLAEQFAQPLRAQVDKYLRVVFPNSSLQVQYNGQQFDGLAVARGAMQTQFPFNVLSTGAREQVATALRLGVAEVLAGNHHGTLPVVFDDAFAYSDPDRLARLRQMLFRAAESGLQVIVLSCNASDYDGLGTRVTLERPSEVIYPAPSPRTNAVSGTDADDLGDDPDDDGATADSARGTVATRTGPVAGDDEQAFLNVLAARGGRSGNQGLREELGWDEPRYYAVRELLRETERINLGRGRGGSVSLPGVE